jgi:tetratricopeptide (TPR) repeat protein
MLSQFKIIMKRFATFNKIVVVLWLFTFYCISLVAQSKNDVSKLLEQAETAQKNYFESKAIVLYKKALAIDSLNFKALFNIAYLYSRQGWLEEGIDEVKTKKYYELCLHYAKIGYHHYPHTFEANLMMAGAIARYARFMDAKGRVHAAWDIKKYADIALKINPHNPEINHLLAWWNYELTKPTWLERKLAQLFFGGIPKGASMDSAFVFLNNALKTNPNYMVYYYDLAVFFNHVGNKLKAIENLKKAILIKPKAPEEFQYLELAKKKLAAWQ